jgi:hypothetical protein
MRRMLVALMITAALSGGCLSAPRDAGNASGSDSTGTVGTSGVGTTSGTSTAGSSGSTGGGGNIDGGALRGLECGDAGACSADQYCVKETTTVAAGNPYVRFSCGGAPACNATPTCDCFTSDAGLCYDPHVTPQCNVEAGIVDCLRQYP